MRLPRMTTRRWIIACVFLLVACIPWAAGELGSLIWRTIQQAHTRELADWAVEYGHVNTPQEAARAIDMIDYARSYYVVSAVPPSDSETDKLLEVQRLRTVDSIVAGLRRFSGVDCGTDTRCWREWLENHQRNVKAALEPRVSEGLSGLSDDSSDQPGMK